MPIVLCVKHLQDIKIPRLSTGAKVGITLVSLLVHPCYFKSCLTCLGHRHRHPLCLSSLIHCKLSTAGKESLWSLRLVILRQTFQMIFVSRQERHSPRHVQMFQQIYIPPPFPLTARQSLVHSHGNQRHGTPRFLRITW